VNGLKAVIMAGGEGTRLRPLTCNMPKPMVPVMNKPVMEHIIELLKRHNITDIAVTLQYMPQRIQEYFGDGSDFGVKIRYYIEEIPLGTAGSVKNAQDFLDDTFIVISGDALTDINLSDAIRYHNEKQSVATLVLTKVDVPLEYGVVVTDSNGRITGFLEKPSWSEVFSDTVNTGIYILRPEILNYYNHGEMFDFSKDLFPMLLQDNQPMYGYVTDDYWCDIGDLTAYQQCHFDILEGKVRIKLAAKEISEKIWVEEGVEIGEQVRITGPVLIGSNTTIRNHAVLSPYTIIGPNNMVGEYCTIKKTVTWKNCNFGRSVQLRGCTICSKVRIGDGSSVFEEAIIGDDTLVKENTIIKPGIKIWPSKIIEDNTEVNVNLIWGSRYTKKLFGIKGIAGEVNVDITPEFASRIGAAYGSLMKKNKKIAVSCDDTNAAVMLKHSVVAGLLSAGVKVVDFASQVLPVTREAIKFYGLGGGIHLSVLTKGSDSKLYIDFLNEQGTNINRATERKLENVFIREDFARCEADAIKKVEYVQDYKSYYIRNIINHIHNKNMGYNVVVGTSSPMVEPILKLIMYELNCAVDIVRIQMKGIGAGRLFYGSSQLNYLSGQVVNNKYDIGAVIEEDCEKLLLIDEKGRLITEELYTALTALITLKKEPGAAVVVPISAPSIIEQMAAQYNGKVIRTKASPLEVMNRIAAVHEENGAMNEQFALNFDAIVSLIKILDYMKTNNIALSDLVDQIPPFHIARKEVECPWYAKGKVIRQIIEESDRSKIELTEGVKIYQEGGWVLVLPDLERPVCKVIGEGYSEEYADEITDFFADKVKEISAQE